MALDVTEEKTLKLKLFELLDSNHEQTALGACHLLVQLSAITGTEATHQIQQALNSLHAIVNSAAVSTYELKAKWEALEATLPKRRRK